MTRKIQYMEAYSNSSSCAGFLYYPSDPFDLAVIRNGKKTVVKPIVQINTYGGYFKSRGESLLLRNFREEDQGTIIPDWAIQWIQDRVDSKPYKIDMRLSSDDVFILEGAINKRKSDLQQRLLNLE